MSGRPLIVLKFGGSVLTDESTLPRAVHEIYRWRRDGYAVVAVVSALAGVTDRLFHACARLGHADDSHAAAAVVSTGDLRTAGLLGLYLERAGIPASVLSPATIRLIADGPPTGATPLDVCTRAFLRMLERDGVVVVAGYIAEDPHGRPVVLGRGGSDLTALYLAHRLAAERCRLVKDVDGLYDRDPALSGRSARRYATAGWTDALATDGSIVQHKAVRFAQRHGIEFELGGLNGRDPTRIGRGPATYPPPEKAPRNMRAALLGLGVVGGGVWRLLRGLDDLVEVTRVVVRDPRKSRDIDLCGVPLTTDPRQAAESGADLVIEVMGGVDDAGAAVEAALRRGAHVVTANKTLLARRGPRLVTLACVNGCRLRYSAAVGGSMPLLERATAYEQDEIRSIRAILSGTTNYVLDRIGRGVPFEQAVRQAQVSGFAEADPARDLDGRDIVDKLCLLATGLGWPGLSPEDVPREPLTARAIAGKLAQRSDCRTLRHIATLLRDLERTRAEVRLVSLPRDDALAAVSAEHNAAIIETGAGRSEVVRGKGAGRWPTAEAVIADVLEIVRSTDFAGRASAPVVGAFARQMVGTRAVRRV